jgi:hypothetical protein
VDALRAAGFEEGELIAGGTAGRSYAVGADGRSILNLGVILVGENVGGEGGDKQQVSAWNGSALKRGEWIT